MKTTLTVAAYAALTLVASLARAENNPAPVADSFAALPPPPSVGFVDAGAPKPPKRSPGAYGAGVAMVSTGAAAFGVSLGAFLLDAMAQSSWIGCDTSVPSTCRVEVQLLVASGVAALAGGALLAGGVVLINSATSAPRRRRRPPPSYVPRPQAPGSSSRSDALARAEVRFRGALT